MNYDEEALRYHKEPRPGKTEAVLTKPFNVLQRNTDMENVVNVIAITVAQAQSLAGR